MGLVRLGPRVVNAGKSGELDAGVDVEFAEDMAQVAIDGVMRNEEALRDLTITQPVRDQPRDRELRIRHARPASAWALRRNQSPPPTHPPAPSPTPPAPPLPPSPPIH